MKPRPLIGTRGCRTLGASLCLRFGVAQPGFPEVPWPRLAETSPISMAPAHLAGRAYRREHDVAIPTGGSHLGTNGH